MRFLAELNLPIAAWCDLDGYGIRMIHNLQKEIGQAITPVGMSADLWRARDQAGPDLTSNWHWHYGPSDISGS